MAIEKIVLRCDDCNTEIILKYEQLQNKASETIGSISHCKCERCNIIENKGDGFEILKRRRSIEMRRESS